MVIILQVDSILSGHLECKVAAINSQIRITDVLLREKGEIQENFLKVKANIFLFMGGWNSPLSTFFLYNFDINEILTNIVQFRTIIKNFEKILHHGVRIPITKFLITEFKN